MASRYKVMAPAIFSITILFFFGEIATRLFLSKQVGVVSDERNQIYRYDKELGWFPIPNSRKEYKGMRLIQTYHNSKGFRDADHHQKQKPRILFVGDSFLWGYDVEVEERFTELLQKLLPDREIINMGISGYGTDQELMLLEKYIDEYSPDIVFLVFCSENDHFDNRVNMNYGGYYKPCYLSREEKLIKAGVPVPKSYNYYITEYPTLFHSYFIRALLRIYSRLALPTRVVNDDPTESILLAMKKLVESRGAQFHIGLTDRKHEESEIKFLDDNGFQFIDISNDHAYPIHRHWTPEGHRQASIAIFDYLTGTNYNEGQF